MSRTKAMVPPTNISVVSSTVRIWSSSGTPATAWDGAGGAVRSRISQLLPRGGRAPRDLPSSAPKLPKLRLFVAGGTCVNGPGVRIQVVRQRQPEKHGKAQHEEVSGGVHVHELQVGEADGRDHSCRQRRGDAGGGARTGRASGAAPAAVRGRGGSPGSPQTRPASLGLTSPRGAGTWPSAAESSAPGLGGNSYRIRCRTSRRGRGRAGRRRAP